MKTKLLIFGALASFGAFYLYSRYKKNDCDCNELNANGNCPCSKCGEPEAMCECDTYEAIQTGVDRFNNWFGNLSANGMKVGDNVYNVKPKRQTIALGASNVGSTTQTVSLFGKH